MARYTIHAGHAKQGNRFSGAVGYVKESNVARFVKGATMRALSAQKDTVYDITVEKGESQSAIVKEQYRRANSYSNIKANISIHLNALDGKEESNGKQKGTEIWLYSPNSELIKEANKILENMEALGFRNRGIKYCKKLVDGKWKILRSIGFLRNTKAPSLLVECFFCDDEDDYIQYKAVGYEKIGKAIGYGINLKSIPTK